MRNSIKIGILTSVCILSLGIVGLGIWGHTMKSDAKNSISNREHIDQIEVTMEPKDESSPCGYQLQVPDFWKAKKMEDIPLTEYYKKKVKVAYVEEFQDSWYATSVHSIVTNLYGMHARLSEKEEIRKEGEFTLVKVVVEYEPSLPEKKQGKKGKKEQHYLFMNGTDTFYDLWVNANKLSEQKINDLVDNFHVC